jgi:hypothetical protein
MSMPTEGQSEVPNESPHEGQGPEYGAGYGPGYGGAQYSGPEYPAPEYGADPGDPPTAQFDAFRARHAEEHAQQEQATQVSYTFPPEYAVSPAPVPVQPLAAMPPGRDRRTRSALIFGGAVLVACVLGLGVWLAFGSSNSSTDTASTGPVAAASASPGAGGTGAAKRALTFRVTIASVGADSFTGKVLANGDSITVTITSDTRFGTQEHAFTQADLTVGETVIVRGKRTATDAVTATEVGADVAGAKKGAATAGATGTAA